MKAGIARAIVNPPATVPHAGWGAQAHRFASGMESDLTATVLYMREADSAGLIADVDLCLFTMEQADRLRSRLAASVGVPKSAVRLSATHTHAGPLTHFAYYDGSESAVERYMAFLEETLSGLAAQAMESAVRVRVKAGYGRCDAGQNRRQRLADGTVVTGWAPDRFADPTLGAILLENEDGGPLAGLVLYGCHPTVLGPDNRLVSPDYPGAVRGVVERMTGGLCLFLQGAAGDVGPGPEGFASDYGAMRRIGGIIGCEASRVLLGLAGEREYAPDRVVESGASLALWRRMPSVAPARGLRFVVREVELPLRPLPSAEEAERVYDECRRELERSLRTGDETLVKAATAQVKRSFKRWSQAKRYAGQTATAVEAQVILIGDIALIGVPLEPFSSTGAYIRTHSPYPVTCFGGYSNGWLGYLPTTEEYEAGGYEVETTVFAAGAAERLADEVVRILRECREESRARE